MTRNRLLTATALAALAASITVPTVAAAPIVRARVVNGTLRVAGSPFADDFALRISANDPNQLQLDIDADGSADDSFDINDFGSIVVEAGRGNDRVVLDTANGAFTTARPTIVDGGRGDDTLLGGSGAERFFGGPGDDFVDGNGGADTAFLGSGNDTFVWDAGDGSDTVDGGTGFDTHVFNGSRRRRDDRGDGRRPPRPVHAQPRRHRHGPQRLRGARRQRRSVAPTPSRSTTSPAPA